MAERQNSKNPIPSNAMADLNDNAMSFDYFMNSAEQYTADRFGNKFKTKTQILKELEASIQTVQDKSFVPIAGGTMSDNLEIRKKGTSQVWLGDTTNQFGMYWNGSAGGFNSLATSGSTITRLRYTPGVNNSNGVWGFENSDVTINGKSALKDGDALKTITVAGNSGASPKWIKIVSLLKTKNGIGNLQLMLTGVGNYGGFLYGTYLIDISSRNEQFSSRITKLNANSSGNTYFCYTETDDNRYDFYVKVDAYNYKPKVSILSDYDSGVAIIEQSLTMLNTEPPNINYIENIVDMISTANIKTYTPQSMVLYPGGSATNLPILSKNERIVIDNPFKTRNVLVSLEISVNGEWGDLNSVYSAIGAKASLLNDNKIVIQAGTSRLVDQTQGNCGSPWENKTHIYSAPYRLRIIKLGE